MNYSVIFLIFQGLQYLNCKSPDQTLRTSLVIVVFNKLVKIDTQAFERKQKMLSEDTIIFYADNVVLVILVVMVQIF